MMLLGYLCATTSERRLAEECALRLAFRWYLGYDFDEPTPNHSVISKARARYGPAVFEAFFAHMLRLCVDAGLVTGEKVFADATLIDANASLKSITPRADAPTPTLSPKEFVKKLFQDNPGDPSETEAGGGTERATPLLCGTSLRANPHAPEPTLVHRDPPRRARPSYRARHKSNLDYASRTDPDVSLVAHARALRPAYMEHFTIDAHARVITAATVTPGTVAQEHALAELLARQPVRVQELCADSKYSSTDNYALCWRSGIRPSIPRRAAPRKRGRVPPEAFRYRPECDTFLCPQGKELRRLTYEAWARRWHARPRAADCRACPLKPQCCPTTAVRTLVRPLEQEAVDAARAWLATPEARATLRQRPAYAEWAIAEAKTRHGLRRAACRGLDNVTIQALLIASVQNLNRFIRWHLPDLIATIRPMTRLLSFEVLLAPLGLLRACWATASIGT